MKIEIIGTGMGPILSSKKLDEIFFGTSTINKKNPLEEAMDKLLDEVKRGEAKTIILDSLGDVMEKVEKDAIGKYKGKPICFDIQSITANHKKNAFTVVWGDGSRTIIHLQKGDVWDDEKALAMCFVKHMMGDTGSFNDIFTKEMPAKTKHIGKVEPVEENMNVHNAKADGGKAFTRTITLTKEAVDKINECECKTPCKECHCETEKATNAFGFGKETADELAKATAKANVALKDMINTLTGKTAEHTEPAHTYKVYIKTGGEPIFDCNIHSIEELRKRVHTLARKLYGRKPYYYRTWMSSNGRMQIDFGHYTKFIEVEGITPDEFAKN